MTTRRTALLLAVLLLAAAILAARRKRKAAAAAAAGNALIPAPPSDTAAASGPSAAAQTASAVFPLQYGSQGPEVKTLQTIIRHLHIYDNQGNDLQPDAVWGPLTEAAAAKLPRYAYYRRETVAETLGLQSPWHRPFQFTTRTVSGRTTIPQAGYNTIVNFYNQNRRQDGTLNLGTTKIL